jgi:hypothetical protein
MTGSVDVTAMGGIEPGERGGGQPQADSAGDQGVEEGMGVVWDHAAFHKGKTVKAVSRRLEAEEEGLIAGRMALYPSSLECPAFMIISTRHEIPNKFMQISLRPSLLAFLFSQAQAPALIVAPSLWVEAFLAKALRNGPRRMGPFRSNQNLRELPSPKASLIPTPFLTRQECWGAFWGSMAPLA